ncbi:AAA family ATPase [Actinoplanes sp. RD1]|uniref:AAA family ATPase n=1 Tax=Actinoplanes sp. RD1 TaxID=3064538 RepID=UPI0027405E41|nr:AAA family ATPase [Actinoplanes sp. RD1]
MTTTEPDRDARLRPEARPLSYQSLDHQQRAAFDRIVGLLRRAAEAPGVAQPKGRRDQGAGPFLDRDRAATTVLVGGQRGTGKTTLLLSLFQALGPDREPSGNRDLDELARHLVWLETIDMEPLSPSTNLLGAVLSRLEETTGELVSRPAGPDDPVGLLSPGDPYHQAMGELQGLQEAVAVAFRPGWSRRAASLDPDTPAVETRRTERARLNLNEQFAGALARLSNVLAVSQRLDRPLFVLPVDDLDLNPTACVELLQLLRAVHSPHLFVLLAADAELLRTVLRLRYRKELREVAGPDGLEEEERRLADVLAASAMRKHIPPHQRIELERLMPGRVVRFRPLTAPDGEELGDLLRVFQLAPDEVQVDGASLDTAGLAWLRQPKVVSSNMARNFSWPWALRLTMRQVVDLDMQARAQGGVGPKALQDVVRDQLIELVPRADAGEEPASALPRQFEDVERLGPRHRIRTVWFSRWQVTGGSMRLGSRDSLIYAGTADLLGDEAKPLMFEREPLQRYTVYLSPEAQELGIFPWPVLLHSRFWGWERMQQAVRDAQNKWPEEGVNTWHGSWLAAMTSLLLEAMTNTETSVLLPVAADSWERLVRELDLLPEGRPGVRSGWRVAVGALCTEEMGFTGPPPDGLIPDDEPIQRRITAKRRERLWEVGAEHWPADLDPPAAPGARS